MAKAGTFISYTFSDGYTSTSQVTQTGSTTGAANSQSTTSAVPAQNNPAAFQTFVQNWNNPPPPCNQNTDLTHPPNTFKLSNGCSNVQYNSVADAHEPDGPQVITTFDTTYAWDGSSHIQPVGNPNTATYGQTFVAPANSVLQDFTFYLNGNATLQVQAQVYAWNGPLTAVAGASPQGATGPALFTSTPITIGPTGGTFVPVTVNTGGTQLTTGSPYIALFTISGPDPTDYTNSSGTDTWAIASTSLHVDHSGGGGFNFDNNGNNYGAITGFPWSPSNPYDGDFTDFGDSVWTATFTAPPID
jgi:hypothetical protein